jgi:hypothetical protein
MLVTHYCNEALVIFVSLRLCHLRHWQHQGYHYLSDHAIADRVSFVATEWPKHSLLLAVLIMWQEQHQQPLGKCVNGH